MVGLKQSCSDKPMPVNAPIKKKMSNLVACSSGGLADLLLSSMLPHTCKYHAVDQSPVQVGLTAQRLKKHGESDLKLLLDFITSSCRP